MTKFIATAALALTVTFASVAPVAAATDHRSDKAPSAKVAPKTDNSFDIEYWGLKHAQRTDDRTVVRTIEPKIVAQSGSGEI